MPYKEWLKTVPESITKDPLWKMQVYRYALFLAEITWQDVNKLLENNLLVSSSDQLYRSTCSVSQISLKVILENKSWIKHDFMNMLWDLLESAGGGIIIRGMSFPRSFKNQG